ncbi:MAG: DUF1016 domain-containing protein, partial [Blastocatellia bacterium]|nr:DUF1016 domain-containing protein [Blastocatellia bacterium]
MSDIHPASGDLYDGIREILVAARGQVQRTVNQEMVQAYWNIGRLLVEHEQGGEARAEYGKHVLQTIA